MIDMPQPSATGVAYAKPGYMLQPLAHPSPPTATARVSTQTRRSVCMLSAVVLNTSKVILHLLLSSNHAQLVRSCRFNPTGCSSRHYGSASIVEHERRAAAAAPLAQVILERKREVAAVTRAKAIYAKFCGFRDVLLRTTVEPSARERAVDPREAEPQVQCSVPELKPQELVPVNLSVVPYLEPLWGPEHPPRHAIGPCSGLPGTVDVRDLPEAVREYMVPYAHLPASVLQRCGREVDGIESEQEVEEQLQAVMASNERANEVAAGIAENGLEAIVFAVGSKDLQERWVDEQRICLGLPMDFSDDTMAWAVKCVGGQLAARKAVESGLSVLEGRRIDIFLPVYVQWVAARVTSVKGEHVTLKFW